MQKEYIILIKKKTIIFKKIVKNAILSIFRKKNILQV